MKREPRNQGQIKLSNKQYSDQSPIAEQLEKNEEPRQPDIIAFKPNRISVERLRTIWNDCEVTYTDDELLRIRDWFYMIAEVTLSTISQRNAQQIEVSSLLESASQPNKTFPFPSKDNNTTTNDEANKKSLSLHPSIYGRTG